MAALMGDLGYPAYRPDPDNILRRTRITSVRYAAGAITLGHLFYRDIRFKMPDYAAFAAGGPYLFMDYGLLVLFSRRVLGKLN